MGRGALAHPFGALARRIGALAHPRSFSVSISWFLSL
jgi:hypothetical protein